MTFNESYLLGCSGHGSFSSNKKLNDFVGNLTHSSILVPYHGWRISHRTHHANHAHVENDESWYPTTESRFKSLVRTTLHSTVGHLANPGKPAHISRVMQLLYIGVTAGVRELGMGVCGGGLCINCLSNRLRVVSSLAGRRRD